MSTVGDCGAWLPLLHLQGRKSVPSFDGVDGPLPYCSSQLISELLTPDGEGRGPTRGWSKRPSPPFVQGRKRKTKQRLASLQSRNLGAKYLVIAAGLAAWLGAELFLFVLQRA